MTMIARVSFDSRASRPVMLLVFNDDDSVVQIGQLPKSCRYRQENPDKTVSQAFEKVTVTEARKTLKSWGFVVINGRSGSGWSPTPTDAFAWEAVLVDP